MKIGVIGTGNIGGTLARKLSTAGHDVRVANSRGLEGVRAFADEIGATAVDTRGAVEGADVIVISIPFPAVAELPKDLFDTVPQDVPVVDTGNYYPGMRDPQIPDIDAEMPQSVWVSKQLGRPVIKAFNNIFAGGKEILAEPQPMLTTFGRLPGLDGDKKMSKSLGNTIHLSDTPEDVTKKVRQMYTDPKRVRADIPGTVEGNPVFVYHDAFNPNTAEVDDLKARYRAGAVGDVEVKTKLANAMNTYLAPIRERRAQLLARPDRLKDILFEGSKRARTIAGATLERVRDAMKIAYR